MKRTAAVLLLLLAPVALLQAQSLTALFRRELPPALFRDAAALQAVETQLGQQSRLHPDLLAPSLRYLGAAFGAPADSQRRVLFRALKARERAATAARNAWIGERAAALGAMDLTLRVRAAAISALEAYAAPLYGDSAATPGAPDAWGDYLAVKYTVGDSAMTYDPAADHGARRAGLDEERRRRLRTAFDAVEGIGGAERAALVGELLEHWYLFPSPDAAFDPAAALARAARAEAREEGTMRFMAAPFFTIRNDAFPAGSEVAILGGDWTVGSEQRPSIAQAGITAAYRFILRGEGDVLSYVAVAAGYARNIGENERDESGMFQRSYMVRGEEHTETVRMDQNRVRVTSATTTFVDVRVPVMYIGRRLAVEAGLHLSRNAVRSTHTYEYGWTNTVVYPAVGGSYVVTTRGYRRPTTEERSESASLVRPSLTVSYPVSPTLSAWAGTTVAAVSAGLAVRW